MWHWWPAPRGGQTWNCSLRCYPLGELITNNMISLTPWTVKYHSQSPHNLLNKIWNKNISRFITSFSSSVKIFWSFLWIVEYVYRLLKNWWDPANKAWEDCLMWFDVGEPAHVWAQLCQVSSPSANQKRVCRLRTNQSKPSVSHPPGLVWEEASISVLHSEKIGRISAVSRAIPRFMWQGLSDFLFWVWSIKYWVRWSFPECLEPALVKMTGGTK